MKVIDFFSLLFSFSGLILLLLLMASWKSHPKIENIILLAKFTYYSFLLEILSIITLYIIDKTKSDQSDYFSIIFMLGYLTIYHVKKDDIIRYYLYYSILSGITYFVASFFLSTSLVLILISGILTILFNLWLYTYIKKNQDPNSPVLS